MSYNNKNKCNKIIWSKKGSCSAHHIVFILIQINSKLIVDDRNAGAYGSISRVQLKSLMVVLQSKVQLPLLEEAVCRTTVESSFMCLYNKVHL